ERKGELPELNKAKNDGPVGKSKSSSSGKPAASRKDDAKKPEEPLRNSRGEEVRPKNNDETHTGINENFGNTQAVGMKGERESKMQAWETQRSLRSPRDCKSFPRRSRDTTVDWMTGTGRKAGSREPGRSRELEKEERDRRMRREREDRRNLAIRLKVVKRRRKKTEEMERIGEERETTWRKTMERMMRERRRIGSSPRVIYPVNIRRVK
ncbi:hypothetical protein PENTCL1PPCAC_12314, partial [Pristionchus entomophagus]